MGDLEINNFFPFDFCPKLPPLWQEQCNRLCVCSLVTVILSFIHPFRSISSISG